ncbi:hypothetical protein D9M71_479460 [compost metagenome]
MDHAGDHYEGAVEPVAHIDVLDLAPGDGAEEQVGVEHPEDGYPQGDGPLHLGVFLGRGDAQRITEDDGDDARLPAPEQEVRQAVGDHPHPAGALHHIEGSGEQRAAAEGEDHQVGMDRADAPEAGPGNAEAELRPHQLGGDEHAHAHAEDSPEESSKSEAADYFVVVDAVALERDRTGHLGSVVLLGLQGCSRPPPGAGRCGSGLDRDCGNTAGSTYSLRSGEKCNKLILMQ